MLRPAWICFSGQDWWYHNRAHSDFQLMRRIGLSRPVLFVNSIGTRMPIPGRSTKVVRRIVRMARSMLRFLRQPLPETRDFYVLTPVILPFYGSRIFRLANRSDLHSAWTTTDSQLRGVTRLKIWQGFGAQSWAFLEE